MKEIITYPDKRLKIPSKPVKNYDDKLHTILNDMYETMIAKNGVGLAAIQIALPMRALILNIPDEEGNQNKENLIEMINPVILKTEGITTYEEGCLSIPGFYEQIERFKYIEVKYYDRNSKKHHITTDNLLSIVIQHEIDHLNGKLVIEKLPYSKRKKFEKELKKELRDTKKRS